MATHLRTMRSIRYHNDVYTLLANCESSTAPTNGNVTLTTNGQVTTAVYTCLSGYTLVGSSVIECRRTGYYKEQTPSCGTCYLYVNCEFSVTKANICFVFPLSESCILILYRTYYLKCELETVNKFIIIMFLFISDCCNTIPIKGLQVFLFDPTLRLITINQKKQIFLSNVSSL